MSTTNQIDEMIERTINRVLWNDIASREGTERTEGTKDFLLIRRNRFIGLLVCIVLGIVGLYAAVGHAFKIFSPPYLLVLTLTVSAIFLIKPSHWLVKYIERRGEAILSAVIALVVLPFLYFFHTSTLATLVYLLLIFEASNRVMHRQYFVLIASILLMLYISYLLFSTGELPLYSRFFGATGIFSTDNSYIQGIPFTTMVNWGMSFILFTVTVRLLHINRSFNRWAFLLTHGRRFGFSSALYTILFSTFYGALSGSPRGNITETAQTTLPIMKQAGYRLEFAVILEATASSIGQMLLPILGITALFVIQHTNNDISYIDMLLASIVPSLLLLTALLINAVVLALELTPMKLSSAKDWRATPENPTNYLAYWAKHKNIQILALSVGLLLFLISTALGVPLALCAMMGTTGVLTIALLNQKKTGWLDRHAILKFFINTGRDSLASLILCVTAGITLVILTDMGILPLLKNGINWVVAVAQYWHSDFLIILVNVITILILGAFLPTIIVFFVAIYLLLPTFHAIGVPDLHAYWFIFFYAAFSGITPPFTPLADEASKLIENKVNKNLLSRFATPILFLMTLIPLAWIQHPGLLLGSPQSVFVESIPLFLSLIVALLGAAIGIYRILEQINFLDLNLNIWNKPKTENNINKKLSTATSYLMVGLALITFLSPWNFISFLTALLIFCILIYKAWHSSRNFLRPAYYLVKRVLLPQSISPSLWFSFTILMFTYLTYFAASGFAHYFEQQSVKPWVQERFHITLATSFGACASTAKKEVDSFLKHEGYSAQTACITTAPANLIKKEPGDLVVTNVKLVEVFDELARFVPRIPKTLHYSYWSSIETFSGACLDEDNLKIQFTLPNELPTGKLNFLTEMKTLHSQQCPDEYGLNEKSLPIIYIGAKIAEIANLKTGMVVSFATNANVEQIKNSNKYYVIAGVFETKQDDLDRIVLIPQNTLSKIYNMEEEEGVGDKLIIKLQSPNKLRDIKNLVGQLKKENIFESVDYVEESVVDDGKTDEIQSGLNTIDATFFVINVVCLVVLIGTLTQLLETKRKMLALLRISTLGQAETWTLLFLLALAVVLIPYSVALPLSLVFSLIHPFIFHEPLAYLLDISALWNLLGAVLISAIAATAIIKYLYFSASLVNELNSGIRHE